MLPHIRLDAPSLSLHFFIDMSESKYKKAMLAMNSS